MLREEILILRIQIDSQVHWINEHHQTAKSLKSVIKEVMSTTQRLQNIIFVMRNTENEAHERVELLLENCGGPLRAL